MIESLESRTLFAATLPQAPALAESTTTTAEAPASLNFTKVEYEALSLNFTKIKYDVASLNFTKIKYDVAGLNFTKIKFDTKVSAHDFNFTKVSANDIHFVM